MIDFSFCMDMNRNHLVTGDLMSGLVRMAGPMLASALLQNVQTFIDLFWVKKLGSDAVAALVFSGMVLMTLFPVIMAVSTGTVAIVSRFIGAGKLEEAADTAGQSLLLAILLGAVSGLLGWFYAEDILKLLGARGDVARLGGDYLRIYFLGSAALFTLFMGGSIFQGAGNTVVPMSAMLLATVLNAILDPVLIYGWWGLPRMEIRGAALAAVLSQVVAALLVLALLSRGSPVIRVHPGRWRLGPQSWKVLRIGLPSSGQLLSRSLMGLVLIGLVAKAGNAAVAGYGIGLRFHMLALLPAFCLGNSLATIVGQNLGAGRPDRAKAAAWMATGIGLAVMAVSAVILMVFAEPLMVSFGSDAAAASDPEVVRIGVQYLRVVSPVYLFAVLAIILGRALQGAGDTMPPMILTLVALWGLQVPLALHLTLRSVEASVMGVWVAINVATVVHGLLILVWFMRGRWVHKQI